MGWLRWDGVKDEKFSGSLKYLIFRGGDRRSQYTLEELPKNGGLDILPKEVRGSMVEKKNGGVFESGRDDTTNIYIYIYICIYIYIYMYI